MQEQQVELEYSLILDLVTSFYRKAVTDVFIGYLFASIDNFPEHIPRIANFWFNQINGQFHHPEPEPFDLIKIHLPLQFKRAHVRRWVILFAEAAGAMEQQYQAELLAERPAWIKLRERVFAFEQIFLKNPRLFPAT